MAEQGLLPAAVEATLDVPRDRADQVDVRRGLPTPPPSQRRAIAEVRQFCPRLLQPDARTPAGIYSTEPIEDAVIEFFHAMDAECPEVFLLLYWGYHSPWWLLHGDTVFDSGIGIEAAHPSDFPGPFRPRQRHPENSTRPSGIPST